MDRQFAYAGAIPLNTDLMSTNLDAYIGLAKLTAAILGTSTLLNGFTCTPTAPASLQVSVSPGEIYFLQEIDPTDYGDLGPDTSHLIMKQGIALDATLLTITPPGTVGYSQNYLIQFAFVQVDGDSTVLAYYNPFDPSDPYSGPNDSGLPDDVVRYNNVLISAKAGVAATTGTQTTPAPDSGYTGGFVVTVANGQTTITSGNISTASNAPFITETLIQKISQTTADARYAQKTQVQSGQFLYGVDVGTVNALSALMSPTVTSLTPGQEVRIKVAVTNTSAATLSLDGLSPAPIVLQSGYSLIGNEMPAGMLAIFLWDGTSYQLVNPAPNRPMFRGNTAFTASGTFTVPANVNAVFVKMYGGGGGGGGGTATLHTAGGGGSGAYAEGWVYNLTPGATVAVTIGAAGVGAGPGGNGTAGTGSSFGAYLTAGGGGGGFANGTSGAGGTAGTGDFTQAGAPGQAGNFNGGSGSSVTGSAGGGYGGGQGQNGAGANAAANSGGGGAGSSNNTTGGNGAAGKCVVFY